MLRKKVRALRGMLWLLATGLLLPGPVVAQTGPATLVLDETFDDNRRNWALASVEKVVFTIEGGALLVRSARDGAVSLHAQGLTPSRDFDLEAEVRLSGNVVAGLAWGSNDLLASDVRDELHHSYNGLLVDNANQEGVVVRQAQGRLNKLLPAVPLPKGGRPGSAHVLRVERRGLRVRCLVDGAELWARDGAEPFDLLAGALLGVYIEGAGELRLDRLRAWEVAPPLALAAPLAPGLRREALGAAVNLPGARQSAPVVSPDGRQLYFIRGPRLNSDIYVAQRQPDSTWADVRPIAELNNANPNSVESITPDGNFALVRGSYNADELKATARASVARRGPDGRWLPPQPLFIQNYPQRTFSRGSVAEYFLAANGLTLVHAISTPGQPDVCDLYASQLQPNGEWGRPKPLGSVVNTPYHEGSPFLAPDGLTLYFVSDGHPGYGLVDVFVTRRLDDTWTNWSPPLNLGPVVNTPGFDTGFSLSAAADYAYLSSKGQIYRLRLPEKAKPKVTLLVRGRVFDAQTKKPLVADIRYEYLPDGRPAGQARAAVADGAYRLALAVGSDYGFRAEAEGYFSASDNLELPDSVRTRGGEIVRNLYLLPLVAAVAPVAPVAARLQTAAPVPVRPMTLAKAAVAALPELPKVVLNNIFFVKGQPILLPGSRPELRRLRQTLLDNPGMVIRLEGHTDVEGDAPKNKVLSEQRVNAVRKFLAGQAQDEPVAVARIQTVGYGEERPVIKNPLTEAERRQNRRVELAIVHP